MKEKSGKREFLKVELMKEVKDVLLSHKKEFDLDKSKTTRKMILEYPLLKQKIEELENEIEKYRVQIANQDFHKENPCMQS